jgi:hypothetical protein
MDEKTRDRNREDSEYDDFEAVILSPDSITIQNNDKWYEKERVKQKVPRTLAEIVVGNRWKYRQFRNVQRPDNGCL